MRVERERGRHAREQGVFAHKMQAAYIGQLPARDPALHDVTQVLLDAFGCDDARQQGQVVGAIGK